MKIQSMVLTECTRLSHYHKAEKIVGRLIISQSPSVYSAIIHINIGEREMQKPFFPRKAYKTASSSRVCSFDMLRIECSDSNGG
jgi:hypothetical protein